MATAPFWKRKRLSEMTPAEWESLCDGCGKCCVHKLEDESDGAVYYTNVACRLLDLESTRCRRYAERRRWVPDCAILSADRLDEMSWLPATCAYRLIHEGRDLYDWHPLVSGDPESVHRAGVSVRGRVVAEQAAGALEDHVVESE